MHVPVLQKEVIHFLSPQSNKHYIDATINQGGHALKILEENKPEGKVLGIDWDNEMLEKIKSRIKEKKNLEKRLILVNENFSKLEEIVKSAPVNNFSGIIFDLGLSTNHLKESNRGFTFQKDEPLIMRFDGKKEKLTAQEIVNNWPREKIEKALKEYGEEEFAHKISGKIIKQRKKKEIKTTKDLVEIIKESTPTWYQERRIHPATKTFQALRIAVNKELENLKKALPQTLRVIERGGRIVVISFHSLEDEIVKNFFEKEEENFKILTKKAVRPSEAEKKENPSSRSARLRAAEIIKK